MLETQIVSYEFNNLIERILPLLLYVSLLQHATANKKST